MGVGRASRKKRQRAWNKRSHQLKVARTECAMSIVRGEAREIKESQTIFQMSSFCNLSFLLKFLYGTRPPIGLNPSSLAYHSILPNIWKHVIAPFNHNSLNTQLSQYACSIISVSLLFFCCSLQLNILSG